MGLISGRPARFSKPRRSSIDAFPRRDLSQHHQQIVLLHLIPLLEFDLGNDRVFLCLYVCLHFHRLGNQQDIADLDQIASLDVQLEDLPWHGSTDMLRIPFFCLFTLDFTGQCSLVAYCNPTGITVHLKKDVARAVRMDLTNRIQLDYECLTGLYVYGGLLARLQAIEENRRRNDRGVLVLLSMSVELRIYMRIEYV